jgi:glycosyltransferase involved in cell wall biosynthesis
MSDFGKLLFQEHFLNKMRIKRGLFVTTSASLGGAERVLLDLLKPWEDGSLSPRPELVSLESGPLLDLIAEKQFQVHVLSAPKVLLEYGDSPARGEKAFSRFIKLILLSPKILEVKRLWKKWISEKKPSWIHSNGLKTHVISAISSPKSTPVFWHIHDFIGQRPLMKKILYFLWRPGIRALAISKAVAEDFQKCVPNCPVIVWRNTIDTKKFRPFSCEASNLDIASGLNPEWSGIRVGMVSTYAKWKGHDVFLKAASIVNKKVSKVRFYLIGGPVYKTSGSQWTREELKEIVSQLKIDDVVGFVPFQQDTPAIYNSLDIVVHASLAPEPFGLVIAEGMSCAKPVVAVLEGGSKEIGESKVDCIGFSSGDIESLAEAIIQLSTDANFRNRLGLAARKKILDKFSDEFVLPRWIDLIQMVQTG